MRLGCLWIRRRIGPYLDRALPEGQVRGVTRHLNGCVRCRQWAHGQERLTALLRGLAVETTDPGWSEFWPGVRSRILSESPLAGRSSTHLRWVSGVGAVWPLHWLPRLAVGSAMAALLLLGLFLWRSDDRVEPQIPDIVVRAIEMPNPNTSVMVFSAPEHEMTVIWVFGLDPSGDQSLRQTEEIRGGRRVPSLPARAWSSPSGRAASRPPRHPA